MRRLQLPGGVELKRTGLWTLLTAVALGLPACLGVTEEQGSLPIEIRVKLRGMASDPPAATPLTAVRQMALAADEALEGGQFSFLTRLQTGEIFATDSSRGKVYRLLERGSSWNAVADPNFDGLANPTLIGSVGGRIWIKDRSGLNIWGREGSPIGRFKVFLNFFSMTFAPDGVLFVNPVYRDVSVPRPLAVQLDSEGGKLREIGHDSDGGKFGIRNQAFLAASDSSVFVAFSRRPGVRAYSRDSGALEFEAKIEHPGFSGLGELADDPEFSDPRKGVFNAPRYLAGAVWTEGRLFVLLHLPRPEILELDSSGEIVRRFRADGFGIAIHYFGFQVQRRASGWSFLLGFDDSEELIRVVEFTEGKFYNN